MMLSSTAHKPLAARTAAGAPRHTPSNLRAGVARRAPRPLRAKDPEAQVGAAVDGGLVNSQFAAVLSQALQRSGGDKAMLDNAAASMEEERAAPFKPVEEMMMTALHTSRATLRTLMERQSLLEAEIAKEQKQAARLEWLLNRCRSDYAFFGALDKMGHGE
ncbi:hypothetical protein Rsub_06064 [Raphidocelis subcapitata]|uniref:Uncharacterized protein n=1 Tax=Raphidocelis subcapitata TaxID=307507 RepID=A0A2V0P498_9CHLO|nr:hypothetical protein Rsub_06064 [Raphidocelis subcapitata]|eukprot:GBF93732.1 hypothetical protein Rsub_06064 [Raphidocelis subcapitata]